MLLYDPHSLNINSNIDNNYSAEIYFNTKANETSV